MYTFFVILIVVASLLMIGIVLIQESKGGSHQHRLRLHSTAEHRRPERA